MSNGGLAQTPNYSALHARARRVGPLQIKGATTDDVLTAKAFNTINVGISFAPTTALVVGVTGRNLLLKVVDANASETAWAFEVQGINQFGEVVTERFPHSGTQAGAQTVVGTKIFTKVTGIIPLTLTGDKAAADTVQIGSGDKVGLDFMFKPDLTEIADMELQVANQATAATKKAISAANLDAVNFCVLEAAFAGSVVVAGDTLQFRVRTDCLTPDDVRRYPLKDNTA